MIYVKLSIHFKLFIYLYVKLSIYFVCLSAVDIYIVSSGYAVLHLNSL